MRLVEVARLWIWVVVVVVVFLVLQNPSSFLDLVLLLVAAAALEVGEALHKVGEWSAFQGTLLYISISTAHWRLERANRCVPAGLLSTSAVAIFIFLSLSLRRLPSSHTSPPTRPLPFLGTAKSVGVDSDVKRADMRWSVHKVVENEAGRVVVVKKP